MYASITVGPPSAAGLASWEAQLVGIEAGLAQQELEADGGELEREAGEPGAEPDEVWREVVEHGVLAAAPHPSPLPARAGRGGGRRSR